MIHEALPVDLILQPRSKSRNGRYKRVIAIDSSTDDEIEIVGVTTQDRESESEKNHRIAERNKRVKVSAEPSMISERVKNANQGKDTERIEPVEAGQKRFKSTCTWCAMKICKIHLPE